MSLPYISFYHQDQYSIYHCVQQIDELRQALDNRETAYMVTSELQPVFPNRQIEVSDPVLTVIWYPSDV